jgi:hypothetical protein
MAARIVSTQPIYSDLFAFGRHTIVWLRVFRPPDSEAVILALSPTDQAGAGPVNDAEALAAAVSERFPDLGPARLLVRFPDNPGPETWTEITIDAAARADFTRLPAVELVQLLGTTLPDPEDPTCAGIGGADHPLLALLPAEEPARNPIDELVVIAVADLPFPHNPSECHWKERFEQLRELYPAEDRERQVVGAHWSTTLAPEDLAACRYHAADWRRIADTGVEILRGLGGEATIGDALEAVSAMLGDTPEADWCRSLFADPIVCHREPPGLSDGQHRSCALRMSGAELCVVAGEGWHGTDPVPADPQRRAAATVSAFWSQRAAR